MDFLKKAKASLAEVQGDLNKATASLGLGDKKSAPTPTDSSGPEPQSSGSTPINTPATSVAPSTAGAPKAKLPLAIRKNVRDNWESAQPNLEKKISDLLGETWKTDIDPAYLYTFAESGYSKDNPGDMIKSYIEGALNSLEKYVNNYGDEGKSELNTLASSHTITMDVTTKSGITYTGCEIVGGVLRILFVKGALGTNVNDSLDYLSEAINQAGTSSDDTSLDFNARSSIKNDYEPKIDAVKAKWQKILALSTIDIEPNFEHNYAAIAAYTKSGKQSNTYPREWQKSLGRFTLEYFSGFVEIMENKGFGDDEMVQEGFKDAVEKNQVALRIVDRLNKSNGYNECVIENGVLYIQTTAEYWATNVNDPAYELMDIL
ncbi:MAG: hypothetical protein Q9191_007454 [Dirinaria sp. TL-2023a]